MDSREPHLSVIVPVYNERESLQQLLTEITQALAECSYEVLFVDDGSNDGSAAALDQLRYLNERVRVVRFARNFGKSAALAAGFSEARGDIIVTLDGDLQDDPAEIPRLVAIVEERADLVIGWKQQRRDPWTKRVPSRFFNLVTGYFIGLRVHDFNSGFKVYRRRVIESISLYGEQHRFVPALAHWKGFRVLEAAVNHRPRRFGKSKFGARRFLAGFFDLFTIIFLTRFRAKPLHLFGTVGIISLVIGLLINAYLAFLWFNRQPIGTRPLLQLGVLLMVTGVQFLSLGLLAEQTTRLQIEAKGSPYVYEVLESPLRTLTKPSPHPQPDP
jgi:glycosyltransferase involved in cell wall biosynthesis